MVRKKKPHLSSIVSICLESQRYSKIHLLNKSNSFHSNKKAVVREHEQNRNMRLTGLWAEEVAKRDKLALNNRGSLPLGDN